MQKRSKLYKFREAGTGRTMDGGKQSLPVVADRQKPAKGSSRK